MPGPCYDAVEAVDPGAGALSDALQDAARKAYEEVDPVGASTTHLLMLFYANLERGLGWHRDNGRSDGRDLNPVVSLSLGAACSFRMKHGPNDRRRPSFSWSRATRSCSAGRRATSCTA